MCEKAAGFSVGVAVLNLYPREDLRARLEEFGIPRERQGLESLRSFLEDKFGPFAQTETDVDDLAATIIYLFEHRIIGRNGRCAGASP